jgi:hypothetical protein
MSITVLSIAAIAADCPFVVLVLAGLMYALVIAFSPW